MMSPNVRDDHALRTVEYAMDFLGIGRTKLYDLIEHGKLEAVKLGRATRITQESLNNYSTELRKNSRVVPGKQRAV